MSSIVDKVYACIAERDRTAWDIARIVGERKPVISGAINRLAKAGLIERGGMAQNHRGGATVTVWRIPRQEEAPPPPVFQPYKPLPEHETLTGAFFGDPIPGRSALDMRRAGR